MRVRNALAATAALALAPTSAWACGGFFCSSSPVDQEAERIIFVQEDENTLRTIVEIKYQGEPQNFAWVVPVPSVPEFDTFFPQAFNALDVRTQPQFNPPPECQSRDFASDGPGPPSSSAENGAEDPVMVLDRQVVGPFDVATIQSEDPEALVQWLQDNDFRVSDEMVPFIALYTADGMKFTAMKLLPDQGTDAIRPISMRYPSAGPMIPLRLTAVAALLEMGVKVWILGDKRFEPSNVDTIEMPLEEIRFDAWTWQHNYAQVVARTVDTLLGPAFVTEMATPTAELALEFRDAFVPDWQGQEAIDARDALADLLASKPYLTRLYTRVSPEEMFIDPKFQPMADGVDQSNFYMLPAASVLHCDEAGAPPAPESDSACDFSACGAAGQCATVGEEEALGCACAEGTVGRAMLDNSAPSGARVACGDTRMNFMPRVEGFADAFLNPCVDNPCGEHGECVSMNGSPTCRCELGFVTVADVTYSEPDAMGQVMPRVSPRCAAPETAVPESFYVQATLPEPGELPYPGKPAPASMSPFMRGTVSAGDGSGCSTTSGSGSSSPAWLLALVPMLLRRRRRD
ncbi:MAG: DUF2330 domain-containing protein [Myxococcales bacterium]|nr:DUF2330 domain-containing protein [Myxococcales bacterium]